MKYIINIIAILLVASLIYLIIQIRNDPSNPLTLKIESFWQNVLAFFKIQQHNIEVESFQKKASPFTLIEKETNLRMFAPDLFGNFTESDWKKFWSIIYGPVKEKQGKFWVTRYRTKEEIEAELIENYPNPFAYLREDYWKIFWQDILNIRFEEEDGQKIIQE